MDLDPMAQADVEREIHRLSRALTEATQWHADAATEAAQADVNFKLAQAKALIGLRARKGTVAEKEAEVLIAVEREFTTAKLTEATMRAAQEKGRNLRAQLDALRSINANVRSVVSHSQGYGG